MINIYSKKLKLLNTLSKITQYVYIFAFMAIERSSKKELLTRIKASRGLIQVVVGARQIGKTTLPSSNK